MRLFFVSVSDYESYSPTLLQSAEDMSELEFEHLASTVTAEQWERIVQNPRIRLAYGTDLMEKVTNVLVNKYKFKVLDIPNHNIFDGDYQKRVKDKKIVDLRTRGTDIVDVSSPNL